MIETYQVRGAADWRKIVLDLSKIRISQLVALSTMLGYILATGTVTWFVLVPAVGTFLLAAGSAAINQLQERHSDRLMKRTRQRPLPAGKISAREGLVVAAGLVIAGGLILGVGTHPTALLLGLFNIAWYNGVYTPLKRVSAYAIFPGSVIGAIPPAIGWVAAGRGLDEPQIWAIAFFFFVWQIPHYWLLLSNLVTDYQRAGFPTLPEKFSQTTFARMTYAGMGVTGLASLWIPLSGIPHSGLLNFALLGAAVWLLGSTRKLVSEALSPALFRTAFMKINVYMLIVMVCLALDRLMI